ncbi:hypothetical protein Ptc2401_02139 [Prosthecochloris sp. CIB 2401]|nr:hypothetical protein Ptc2401_02139 [Prosthecochloris sp. CIB 2401]
MHRRNLIAGVLLLCAFPVDGGAGEQMRMELMFTPDSAVIGQKVEYRARAWHRPSELPRFSMQVAETTGALVPLEGFAEVVRPGVTEWRSVLLVAGSGRLALPGIGLELTDTLSGNVRRVGQSPPGSLQVLAVTPDTTYVLHPLRAPVKVSGRGRFEPYWLVVVLAVLIALVSLVLPGWLRRDRRVIPESVGYEVSLLAKLEGLLAGEVFPAGDVRCADEIGRVIRAYLASACGIDAKGMTTTEIAMSPGIAQHPFGDDFLGLLTEMDRVKFAGVPIGHEECREAILHAIAVIGREPPRH